MRLGPGMYREQGKTYIVEDEFAAGLGFTRRELLDTRLDMLIGIVADENDLDPATFERVRSMPDFLKDAPKGRRG